MASSIALSGRGTPPTKIVFLGSRGWEPSITKSESFRFHGLIWTCTLHWKKKCYPFNFLFCCSKTLCTGNFIVIFQVIVNPSDVLTRLSREAQEPIVVWIYKWYVTESILLVFHAVWLLHKVRFNSRSRYCCCSYIVIPVFFSSVCWLTMMIRSQS